MPPNANSPPDPPWKPGSQQQALDKTPTGAEELIYDFLTPEEKELHAVRLEELKLKNAQFGRDMDNREEYAGKAFGIAICWLLFVVVLTAAQFYAEPIGQSFCPPATPDEAGVIEKCTRKAGLGATEFAAVIGSTTVTVLGFWLLVGRYLFHRPDSAKTQD